MPARQLHQRSMTSLNTGTLSNIGIPGRSIASVLSVLFSTSLYLAIPGVGQAEPAAATRSTEASQHYSIAAGSLASALRSLASSANVLLTFTDEQTAGKTTAGIAGQYTLPAALSALLAGTGMQAVQVSGGGYVLREAPEVGVSTLPEMAVKASREPEEKATGPVHGYAAKRSAAATKTDTPIIETPQSISVVGRQEMDARGVQSVMEALRYVPGVAVDTYGVETRGSEWALMRGFDSNNTSTLVNGLRLARSTWINFQTEAYGLERVEVLRGPASVTYGQVEAGGTINRVSKQPDLNMKNELMLQSGTYGRTQLAADVGGVLNEDGTLLYRMVGVALDTDNQLKFANGDRAGNERLHVAPSLKWQPSENTTLTVLAELQRNINDGFSVYVMRNGQNTGLLRGDPKYLRYDQRQTQLGYQFEHKFNDSWALRQNFIHAQASLDNHYINQLGAPVGNLLQRSARYADDSLHQTAVDTHIQANLGNAWIAHQVLLGVDWSDADASYKEFHAAAGATPALNLDNPIYGVPFPSADVLKISRTTNTQQLGVYLQDQIKVNQRWVMTLGGRYDTVDIDTHNRLAEVKDSQRDHAFSGRAGLSYLADNGIAPYVSYGESFMPQNLKTSAGAFYQPTRGRQWEAGVKYQPADGKSLFTAAWFDLTKSNVETYDVKIDDYRQTGKVRSRGLELEARGEVLDRLNIYSAYTYNDVKVTKSTDVDLGKTPIQVPRYLVSVGLDYAFGGILHGLSMTAGVRYVGKRYDNADNTQSTPSYTLVDAGARYRHGAWLVALNIANLFDKEYVASQAYGGYYPGAERNTLLTAKYFF